MPPAVFVKGVVRQDGGQGTVGVSGQQGFNIGFRLLAPERTAAAAAVTQTVAQTTGMRQNST